MKRTDAIKAISDCFRNEYLIACNGFISRELFNLDDSPRNFYVLGSMGLPPAIGLGVALAKPDKKVIVITGDGNQLMSLGTLVTIGRTAPKNFIEIILDNECYETTGGQDTASAATRFYKLASASSFKRARYVESIQGLQQVLKECRESDGPMLIHAKTEKGETAPPRAEIDPSNTKTRFMKALRSD